MLLVNTKIKPFCAMAFKPNEKDFVEVNSQELQGKWSIFFFYPADFTFVCPTELEDLADNYDEFTALGVDIFTVSTDSHFCHKAWYDSSDAIRKIKYTMISDNTFEISRNFEILRESEGRSERGTFVVDPDGIIQVVEITCEGVGRDANHLLEKVKAAQYVRTNPDEVCPAKWKEGEATLAPSLDLVGKI